MRDGVALAKRGIPVATLVTENFRAQGDFVARSVGMPDVPRLELPHPVAGTGADAMRAVAERLAPEIVRRLRGTR